MQNARFKKTNVPVFCLQVLSILGLPTSRTQILVLTVKIILGFGESSKSALSALLLKQLEAHLFTLPLKFYLYFYFQRFCIFQWTAGHHWTSEKEYCVLSSDTRASRAFEASELFLLLSLDKKAWMLLNSFPRYLKYQTFKDRLPWCEQDLYRSHLLFTGVTWLLRPQICFKSEESREFRSAVASGEFISGLSNTCETTNCQRTGCRLMCESNEWLAFHSLTCRPFGQAPHWAFDTSPEIRAANLWPQGSKRWGVESVCQKQNENHTLRCGSLWHLLIVKVVITSENVILLAQRDILSH